MEAVSGWNSADMSRLTEVIFTKVAAIQATTFEELLTVRSH